jgi:hypothetical protein
MAFSWLQISRSNVFGLNTKGATSGPVDSVSDRPTGRREYQENEHDVKR